MVILYCRHYITDNFPLISINLTLYYHNWYFLILSNYIALFDTFDTKYRTKNITHTDSNSNTNPHRHMVAIIIHLLL